MNHKFEKKILRKDVFSITHVNLNTHLDTM